MADGGERVIRVIGAVPQDPDGISVDILLDEGPLVAEMLDYSRRILQLSLVLAAITAGLVFLALHLLLVRPLGQISYNLVTFRRDPEDATTIMRHSRRRDEIGVAQRELRVMQQRVRAALRQKARLAAVGAAVSKINHDLHNMLATAVIVSDRLAVSEDPAIRKASGPLLAALNRAINLCSQTLSFARAEEPDPERSEIALAPLVEEIALVLPPAQIDAIQWRNDMPQDVILWADQDQIYRILMNLTKNAVEAVSAQGSGGTVRVTGGTADESIFIEVGGTGLGLAIAYELTRNHGGRLELTKSDPTGTVFRAIFPNSPPPPQRRIRR